MPLVILALRQPVATDDPGELNMIRRYLPGVRFTHVELVLRLGCGDSLARPFFPEGPCASLGYRCSGLHHVCISSNKDNNGPFFDIDREYSTVGGYVFYPHEISYADMAVLVDLSSRIALSSEDDNAGAKRRVFFNDRAYILGHLYASAFLTRFCPSLIGVVYERGATAMRKRVLKARRFFCSELVLSLLLTLPFFNEVFYSLRTSTDVDLNDPCHSLPDDCHALFVHGCGGAQMSRASFVSIYEDGR